MSIRKEKNGTYSISYTKIDYLENKKHRTLKRGFKTLREAKEFERNLDTSSSSVSFYALFLELQNSIEQEEDTFLDKVSSIKKYLPSLLTIRYCDLTKPYLINLRNKISEYDLSAKTKNKLLWIVVATCRYANNIYDLQDNSKVLKRFKSTKKFEMSIWSPDEYFTFEESLIDSPFADCVPFFRCLFFTGMRKGEARALLVDDLDVDNATISISKSMRKYKSSLKSPKTLAGNRKIRLDKNTLELLKPLKAHEKWLFGDYKAISRDRVDRAFKYGIEKSGVKKIRIHDLRHSHASYLINSGANILVVSKRLGHSSINMTLSTYAHLMKEAEDKAIEMLESVKM